MKMKKKGNIIISILFIILVSFIGLSLLTHTIIHTKITRARTKKILETDNIHQNLIQYLHNFREKIFQENLQNFKNPEIDYFNNTNFPDFKNNNILIKNSFKYISTPKKYYKKIKVNDNLLATSERNSLCLSSNAIIKIISGKIPFTLIPFFINKEVDIPKDVFMQENNIKSKKHENLLVNNSKTEFNVSEFLLNSLKIKGNILSWRNVREKFGFEISDEPIDEGIYILSEDDVVESIFVQGNVEKIIFSIQDNIQIIQIIKEGNSYEINYTPNDTYFICWDNTIDEQSIFKEKIIINGNIGSIEQKNEAGFLEDSNIKVFSSGTTIIKTSLKTKNFDSKKTKLTNLTLISSFNALYNQANPKSNIIVDTQNKTEIHASIIINGKFTNKSQDLKLSGSLFAKDLENKGIIEIEHLNSKFDSGNYYRTKDFKYLKEFFIDSIEEIYYE